MTETIVPVTLFGGPHDGIELPFPNSEMGTPLIVGVLTCDHEPGPHVDGAEHIEEAHYTFTRGHFERDSTGAKVYLSAVYSYARN
jgi:hypothetical protein